MPKIFCAILGEEGGVCRVEVDHDATGDDLTKAIKQENPDIMCSARKIRVFLAKDGTTWLISPAARAVPLDDQGLPRGFEEIHPEQQLSDPRLFGEDFNPARGVIHVLATLPPFSCTQLKPQALELLEAVMVRTLVQVPTTVSDDNRDFKDALCEFYGCRRPNGRVRCMLLDEALPQSLVAASHLFRRENKDLAKDLLKVADVDDAKNGLLLFKPLKYAFDRYQISFIGDDKGALRLKLFDPSIRDTRLVDFKDRSGKRVVSLELLRGLRKSTRHFDAGTTFGNVDGKALAFTGLRRPFYSCLNFQARVARVLALRKEWVEPSYDFVDFWSEEASINDKMELFHQKVNYGAPGYGYGVGSAVSVGVPDLASVGVGVGNGGVGVGANVLGLGAHVGVGLPGVGYPAGYPAGYPVNGVPSTGVYNTPPPAANSAPAYNNAPATVVNAAPTATSTTTTTTGGNGASTANANANANVNGGNNPYSTKTIAVSNGDGTSNTASVSNGNGAAANGGASASAKATASASASASARATAGASATSSQKTYRQLRSVE